MTEATNGEHMTTRSDPALRERVSNLSEDVRSFRVEIHDIRSSMATKTDMVGLQAAINALADRQKPNYTLLLAAVGLAFSVLVALGGFAYWPINAATNDLKAAVIALSERAVTQRQYEADVALARADRTSIRNDLATYVNNTIQTQRYNADKISRDDEIKILRERFEKILTRAEFDAQHGDMKAFIQALMASRDRSLVEMTERIKRMEDMALKR